MHCDLSDLRTVQAFARQFLEMECALHCLVCNAAKMATPLRRSAQVRLVHVGLPRVAPAPARLLGHAATMRSAAPRARTARGVARAMPW